MKKTIVCLALVALTVGCRGPGGPAQNAGRTVDNAVYDVGTGVKRTGQAIQNTVD